MNLNKLNVTELNAQEVLEVEGGNKYKKAWKLIEKGLTLIGVADAVERFVDGWNSESCGCNK
ncbi:hypothetical protein AB4865_01850 [Capnocytophaga sp. ARDL2]|uniref:hypothetical protein n=1 Tax=Capnocytophaga sp. ARDL2 TaxID=3238809 RepID=UPI00355763B4